MVAEKTATVSAFISASSCPSLLRCLPTKCSFYPHSPFRDPAAVLAVGAASAIPFSRACLFLLFPVAAAPADEDDDLSAECRSAWQQSAAAGRWLMLLYVALLFASSLSDTTLFGPLGDTTNKAGGDERVVCFGCPP